ncbi:hypothetical protein C8Q80DRAFT_378117 [Daedaleopsis nitida]|nr:hypothetical protein C8Q80DRAFT_378117 [Daedaleopsis nitida]
MATGACRNLADVLDAAIENVVQQRWGMSIEMLSQLQKTLHLASSLVQETMNAHSPINKLPPELLALVFSMVPSPLSIPGYIGPSAAKQTYELVPVTHVCRGWRALALDMPSLWSTICETGTGHIASAILRARAQQAPLVVYADRGRPSAELAATVGGGAKVTELHLHDVQEIAPAELASDLLGFPAHRLERVVVRRRVPRTSAFATETPVKPVMELFEGVAPKLKSIVLHDVPFLPSNWFGALTHLRLSFEASPVYWTLADLFLLLSQAPALEDVRLVGLPTHLHSADPPIVSSIALSRLRRLEIGDCRGQDGSIILARGILSFLVLPAQCQVRLYGVEAHRPSPLSDIRFPFADQSTELAIEVTFTAFILVSSNPEAGSSLRLELNTAGATRTLLQQSIETFIAGHAPSVKRVSIAGQRVWASWCDPNLLLSLISNATALDLCDAHLVDQCLDALRPTKSAESEPCTAVCANLEVLRLPLGLTDLLMEKLRSVLEERERCGLRLQCIMAGSPI